MHGDQVDFGELWRVARLVRELSDAFAAGASTRYAINPSEIGHPELAAALDEFQDQSGRATDLLDNSMTETAYRLRDTAAHYRDRDQELADLITGMDGR
jgi:hypothetical protein